MTVVITITLGLVMASAVLALVAAIRGPTAADRMLAVDLFLLLLSGGLAVALVLTDRTDLLPVLLVVSLVAFVGTVVVGRMLERAGRR